jgi:hypothetical protein
MEDRGAAHARRDEPRRSIDFRSVSGTAMVAVEAGGANMKVRTSVIEAEAPTSTAPTFTPLL